MVIIRFSVRGIAAHPPSSDMVNFTLMAYCDGKELRTTTRQPTNARRGDEVDDEEKAAAIYCKFPRRHC